MPGRKEVKSRQVEASVGGRVVSEFPYDAEADWIYLSRAGFLPPDEALVSVLAHAIHYGSGFFEGMRAYYSPYGTALIEPWANIARLMHSASAFHPGQALLLHGLAVENGWAEAERLSPGELYALARKCYKERTDLTMGVRTGDGKSEDVPLSFRAVSPDGVRYFSMSEMDAVIKATVFLNGLVSCDYFPPGIEMVQSGYIRLFGFVAGQEGLKLQTIVRGEKGPSFKEFYFGVATLPWGTYLKEEDYAAGLDVLVAPVPRIGEDMPYDKKVAGNYVNSTMNANFAAMLGFGEVLVLRDGRVVEGSAENLFAFFEGKGKMVAYTPPLSAGCLPGTTRDRIIRVLERMGVELHYEALPLEKLKKAAAILLTGTGAQFIHVRSITEIPGLENLAKAGSLRSEEEKNEYVRVSREELEGKKAMLNGGKRHPVIERVSRGYCRMVMEEGCLVPAHDIDFHSLAGIMRLGMEEISTNAERRSISAGYFTERINGLKQPDELKARVKAAAKILERAVRRQNGGQAMRRVSGSLFPVASSGNGRQVTGN
ncbi:MAG: aminotransferase class IV [Candidatus Micrarchaeota archaeon]